MNLTPPPLPFGSQELLSRDRERWDSCGDGEEATLLRLEILRDLVRALHAEKSSLLAKGKRAEAQTLKEAEQRIEELRSCGPLQGDFTSVISGEQKLKKKTRLLPEAIFSYLSREKLERYDMQWERAIASEGAAIGWKLWSLEAWIDVGQAETWNQLLGEAFWPHGLILMVESSESNQTHSGQALAGPATAESTLGPSEGYWCGRWLLLLHPRFKAVQDLPLDPSQWPGAYHSAPQPLRWKLLFSPKKR